MASIAVPLEGENHVDDVLEQFRTRELPFLRDMPDDDEPSLGHLGRLHEIVAAATQLGRAPGRRIEIGSMDHLDRIEHDEGGLDASNLLENPNQGGFGTQEELVQARGILAQQPVRPKLDLLRALFTAGVEHATTGPDHADRRLKQQGALPNPRLAAQKHGGTRHDSSTEHAIELRHPGRPTRNLEPDHVGKRGRLGQRQLGDARTVLARPLTSECDPRHRTHGGRGLGLTKGFEGVPTSAVGASPHPLWMDTAAIAAEIGGSRLRHGHRVYGPTSRS